MTPDGVVITRARFKPPVGMWIRWWITLLDIPDAGELFSWLRTQPFVDPGPFGLHLQDLARNVLASDLRWRHPDRYAAIHSRARGFYLDRLDSGAAAVQGAVLMDLMFLHPDLRQFLRPPEPATTGQRRRRRPAGAAATRGPPRGGGDSRALGGHRISGPGKDVDAAATVGLAGYQGPARRRCCGAAW